MININNITLRRGNKVLLQNASLSCYAQQKIGIVGKNGCGKTSLFALLQNKLTCDNGEIFLSNKLDFVSVEQEIPVTERNILDYVIDADIQLRKLEADLKIAEKNNQGEKIAQIYEILHHQDGFTSTARASKILLGLGFDETQLMLPVNSLSGGWRMRLNIARALFIPSDALLLDEPTNHLDLDAVIWLEKWLQKYQGLLLLISHDREFLDHIVTHIAHIEHKNIKLYKGNYSDFETQRTEQLELQGKQYAKQQQHIAHMQEFIERFRYKATKAKQAQSRLKALNKLEKILPAHLDSPFTFTFKKPSNLSNPLINCTQLGFFYEEMQFILRNVNFSINVGDRIGLLGRNGAGKSTFIKLLAQNLKPISGQIISHKKLKIGYFTQNTLDTLNPEKTALEHLKEFAINFNELDLRKFLGSFAFSDESALMPVKYFSGGEKARLALALIIWQAPNILLLDEPTNHLDMDMRQALALAIQDYYGAVITVSHDRFLLEQIVDDFYLVDRKNIAKFNGSLHEYEQWLLNDIKQKDKSNLNVNVDVNAKNLSKEKTVNNTEKPKKPKKNMFLLQKAEQELNELNQTMLSLDQELIQLSENLPIDIVKLNNVTMRKEEIMQKIIEKEEEWLQLVD